MTADARVVQTHPRELVQLLTPEGERVEHPDYPMDLTAEEIRGLYRDLVLVRRIDPRRSRCSARASWASGPRCSARKPPRSARAARCSRGDMAFPTYREHGVAWCRGVDPVKLLGLYRGVSHGGWDPEEHNFHLYTIVIGSQTLHATGYAMGIQRDGAEARRDRLLRRRRHQPGRRERGVHLGLGVQRPDRVLLPEQPVGDLRAAGEADAASRSTGGPAGSASPGVRVDGNDVLRLPRRDPQGAGRPPGTGRARR